MAWVAVPGTNSLWEYENAATASNTYADAPGTYSGGIRTYTTPGTGQVNKLYARTRLKGEINLFQYSEQLDNAYWDTSGASITANATTDPDGITIADKVISTSTSGSAVIKTPTGLTASAEYTMSIFAKAGDNNIFRIANVSSGGTGAWFNLTDGTIGTQNGGTNSSTITPVGDGWYKCTRTFPSLTVSGNNTVIFGNCSADGTTSGPPVGEFIYLWGAMLNEGPKVNKYIKTEASASTTIERGELSKDFYDATHVGF